MKRMFLMCCLLIFLFVPGMAQKIVTIGTELIRMDAQTNKIEYSINSGRSWHYRSAFTSSQGVLSDLLVLGKELLACTNKGVYYSTNKGQSWHSRFFFTTNTSFTNLQSNGTELLGSGTKGLYYSKNGGRSWHKRN